MSKSAKGFAEALHKSLDELNVPTPIKERSAILSKMLDIPKQQAWSMLEGHVFPDQALLDSLASELDIDFKLPAER